MITNFKQAKKLAEEYNKINDDMERLQFLKDHNTEMMAVLDNDATMVEFIIDDDVEQEEEDLISKIDLNEFDDYHYWSEGCLKLFDFAGITADCC